MEYVEFELLTYVPLDTHDPGAGQSMALMTPLGADDRYVLSGIGAFSPTVTVAAVTGTATMANAAVATTTREVRRE
jgi:hypothetical protein